MFRAARQGFTLMEMLLSLAIIAILAGVGGMSYLGTYRVTVMKNAAEEIITELRLAQQRAMSQEQGSAWGVYIDNSAANSPYLDLFMGTYATSTVVYHYPLPETVGIQAPASGTTLEILFAKLTGIPSTSTAIVLRNRGSGITKTITLNEFGALSTD